MLFPEKELPKDGNLSNAHHMTTIAKETHEFFRYEEPRMDLPHIHCRSGVPLYQIIKPKDVIGSMILWDHSVVYDYNRLSSMYPNFTEIVVTVKPQDKNNYDFMYFLKFGEVDCIENWNYLQKKTIEMNPDYNWIFNYSAPSSLIADTEYFTLFSALHFGSTNDDSKILADFAESKFVEHVEKNSNFASNIHSIDFKTILTNMDTTLNKISEIIKVPVSDKAKTVYDRWINKQILLDTLMGK